MITIKRRQRDIKITFIVPLPRRWWRKVKHTPEARENMRAAQKRRWATKANGGSE